MVAVEKLNISGMIKNHYKNAAKNILNLALEQGFGENTAIADSMNREATRSLA